MAGAGTGNGGIQRRDMSTNPPDPKDTWLIFTGDGRGNRRELPEPPPWRRFPAPTPARYETYPELVNAINASIYLRRPLLLTGAPGIGKSSVADAIAAELGLGDVLRWHITSRATLEDGIYRYDALGRLYNQQVGRDDAIEKYLRLGPLGTALAADDVRLLLIDELDKSDVDLPGDLLNVLERGEYEIPELARHDTPSVKVRVADGDATVCIQKGKIACSTFPVIVITSNGEREFPAAFLRRCVREHIPPPDQQRLARIVTAHLGEKAATDAADLIEAFAHRIQAPDQPVTLAIDQLLNTVFLMTRSRVPSSDQREKLIALLQRELRGT
jgi:MoxR-like ATPase